MSKQSRRLVDMKRLQELIDEQQDSESYNVDPSDFADRLRQRVVGQDHVIDDMTDFIWRQSHQVGRRRPVASLLFVGPSGVGKSEMAKAMAEYLFGEDDHRLVIDFNTLPNGESATYELTGSPGVYKGSGIGKLTGPIIRNRRQLVNFEEIEKADKSIFQVLMQMFDEGRLQDKFSNEWADFRESIIVMTSNADYRAMLEIEERVDDPDDKTKAVKDHLVHGGFMAPEIAARIDRVYVFRHLSKELMIEMIEMKISSFGKLYDVEIVEVAPEIFLRILQRSDKVRESGMREINRIIDKEIGGAVTQAKQNRLRQIRLLDDEGDILVEECDD